MRSATVVLFSSTAEANTSDHVDFRLRLTEIKSLQIEWISSRATKTFRAKEYRGPRGADVYPKMFSRESRAIMAWTTHSRWRKYIRAVDTRLGERHAAIMQWFSSCDNAYTVHVREWRVVQVHSVSNIVVLPHLTVPIVLEITRHWDVENHAESSITCEFCDTTRYHSSWNFIMFKDNLSLYALFTVILIYNTFIQIN